MSKLCTLMLMFLSVMSRSTVAAPDITALIEQQLRTPELLFTGVLEEKKKQIESLNKRKSELSKEFGERAPKIKTDLEEVQGRLDVVEQNIKQDPTNNDLKQVRTLLGEIYQMLKDMQRYQKQQLSLLDATTKLLTTYIEDPDFNTYKRELAVQERIYATFEELQKSYAKMHELERSIETLIDQDKGVSVEVENRKRIMAATQEEYRRKKEAIDSEQGNQSTRKGKILSEIELLEDKLYDLKRQFNELRVAVVLLQKDFAQTQLFIERGKFAVVKDQLKRVKPLVRVGESDIMYATETLARKQQEYFKAKTEYTKRLDQITEKRRSEDASLSVAAERLGVVLGKESENWQKEVAPSVAGYAAFAEIATKQTTVQWLSQQQEIIEARIVLEDEQFQALSSEVKAKETYHKIIAHKFQTEEDIGLEIKAYETIRADALNTVAKYKERTTQFPVRLNEHKKILDAIRDFQKKLTEFESTIFINDVDEFKRIKEYVTAADAMATESLDILSKMTGVYSGILSNAEHMVRTADFMLVELRSITLWYRPEGAISWQGLKNIGPDIFAFWADLKSYLNRVKLQVVVERVYALVTDVFGFGQLVTKLIVLAFLLIVLRMATGGAITLLQRQELDGESWFSVGALALRAWLQAQYRYYWFIFLWIMVFAGLLFSVQDPYIYVFFFLLSIPYLLVLYIRLITYMRRLNETEREFVGPDFQRRLWFVLLTGGCATIAIALFRAAFILVNYYGSELPRILLALNFIVFQVLLILLITREQIVNLIPDHSESWAWVREQVDYYFYFIQLLVIATIIMSNPYVGYGQLVLHTLVRSGYSILLFITLVWFQRLFKRETSRMFFQTEEDVGRERFSNAKTWFGILVILFFVALSFIGIVVGAKIWGWPITYQHVISWYEQPIIGERVPISLQSILKLLLFLLGGAAASYALNKHVLNKIFDLLLVDSGVQYTVTTLAGYAVFIIALFLGFNHVGLGDFVAWSSAGLLLSLGWVLKDPIADFFAYFVILVQRPVKIGDYIYLNEHIMGVVRKITPRAVILRKRNSMTIVVPNSQVLNHPIINWNYIRGFVAFNDIIVLIDYHEDPDLIRAMLMKVVQDHPNILKTPSPIVRLDSFTEYGYSFMVRGFMNSSYTLDMWEIASDIRMAIARTARKEGIRLALPLRMVVSGNDKVPTSREDQHPVGRE